MLSDESHQQSLSLSLSLHLCCGRWVQPRTQPACSQSPPPSPRPSKSAAHSHGDRAEELLGALQPPLLHPQAILDRALLEDGLAQSGGRHAVTHAHLEHRGAGEEGIEARTAHLPAASHVEIAKISNGHHAVLALRQIGDEGGRIGQGDVADHDNAGSELDGPPCSASFTRTSASIPSFSQLAISSPMLSLS